MCMFIVSLFESQQLMRRKENHDKISEQLTQQDTRFAFNYEKVLEKNKEIEKRREQQAFKKFAAYVR